MSSTPLSLSHCGSEREREREVSQCLHTARATGYMWASMASHISARRDNVKEQGQMEEITWLVSVRKGRL